MGIAQKPGIRFACGMLAAGTLAGVLSLATAAQADTWKYAFEEALTEVQGVYARKFREVIEANSDHRMQLFPFGTLGESTDIMEQTRIGNLHFVDQSPGFTGSLIPEAQVFFVPYLLPTDQAHLARFYKESKAINEGFKDLYARQGLELLHMFPEGEVAMTTKAPVRSCEDLHGVKFRVMTNPLLAESYRAFGAIPVPLPWGEVFDALQANAIQGQENPAPFLHSTGIYDVTDHITFAGHNTFTTAVMANKEFFDGLPEKERRLIRKAASEAFDHIVAYQQGLAEEALHKIKEAKPGMTVTVLNKEERLCFKVAGLAVEDKFIEMTGDSGKAILEQMKADLEATK